uniref:GLOBIN domain-containing protein n=1 Tax=Panagrellus redivivus TaxID=6233 RepID=A0A7E4URV8_PANRE
MKGVEDFSPGLTPTAIPPSVTTTSVMEGIEKFTAADKQLVLKTWNIVSRNLNTIGGKIFEMIFAQSPDTKALFPFTKQNPNPGKNDKIAKDIQFHGLRFMQIIESTVKSLDTPRNLEPLLDNLGRRHGRLTERTNFRPYHWAVFIECTLFHFRSLIQADKAFSHDVPKVDQAIVLWRTVLRAIIKRMKMGLQQDLRNRKCNRELKMNTNLSNGFEKMTLSENLSISPGAASMISSKSSIDSNGSG